MTLQQDLPVFVISLPEASERRARIEKRLQELGFTFTFFDAVDGRGFDMNEHSAYDGTKRRRYFGKDLTGGELGCLLSHRSIFKKIAEENIPRALIFEDDVIIHDDFPAALQALLSLPLPYELVRFLGSPKVAGLTQRIAAPLTAQHSMNRIYTTPGGAHAYLITNQGAQKLLTHTERNFLPVDTLMGYVWKTKINAFIVQPGVAVHDLSVPSYIGESRFEKQNKPNPVLRAGYKVYEAIMKRLAYYAAWPQDQRLYNRIKNRDR